MAERVPKSVRVVSTSRISPLLVRLVVSGDSLVGFDPVHADSYVKLCFPDGTSDRPRMRTYTVRAFDPAAVDGPALTLDVVVHGDSGLAGPWAASAQVGDEALLLGPGGGYTPSPVADFHLLAGDESALPAIAVALERIPSGVPVQAFVEVRDAADELDLPGVTWLHRADGGYGSALVEAVTNWTAPAGDGHWFVHGEAAAVKQLRTHLRVERGVPLAQLSISGYWRLGVDDEGWRAVKRDWNREIEEAEAALA